MTLPSLMVTGDSVITVRRDTHGAILKSKRSILCADGLDDGLATLVETRQVDAGTWRTIAECMDRAFWSAPLDDGVTGFDGVTTLVEGVRDGKYRVVHRWSLTYSDTEPARRELLGCLSTLENAAGWRGPRVLPPMLRVR